MRLADPAAIRRRATPEGYRALLAQLDAAGAGPQIEGILLALFRLRAGDADGALSALEAFPAEHLWMRAWLHVLPALDELRGHPRMQAVASREGIAAAAVAR